MFAAPTCQLFHLKSVTVDFESVSALKKIDSFSFFVMSLPVMYTFNCYMVFSCILSMLFYLHQADNLTFWLT